ncbi:Hypothetical protein FKW44_021845 [Caligus rogercresseyi]|uniref:Uncharacterized protein n=1 Tax=Caligus rogercresseyi TaxID=217165 RepID=A0A7T8GS10_CALRO|nr:Hypothetical protein FKW44_021845 [Caligus rogercresseyi]
MHTNPPPMGPRVLPNTIGVFWGYKSPANGPLGSAKPNRGFWGYKSPTNGPLGSSKPNQGVLGLKIYHEWALMFCRTQLECFGVTNPPPMGPWVQQPDCVWRNLRAHWRGIVTPKQPSCVRRVLMAHWRSICNPKTPQLCSAEPEGPLTLDF